MAKPLSTTTWATDTNIASGTETGTPTKVDPGAGYRAQGGVPGLAFIAPYWNYVVNLLCQWMVYLDGITTDSQFLGSLFAWTGIHTFTPSTAATDGLTATGNTTGAGLRGLGGSTGAGVRGTGGTLGGNGGNFYATASGADGVQCSGVGAGHGCKGFGGTTGAGHIGTGGSTSGVLGLGTGAAAPTMTKEGVYGVGGTSAPGVKGEGGAFAAGGEFSGVDGVVGESTGAGAGGRFLGPVAYNAGDHALEVEARNINTPHIQLVTGINANPAGAAHGSIWLTTTADGMYFQVGLNVYSFEAAGLYRNGVLIA
jgi:hypothetical protein